MMGWFVWKCPECDRYYEPEAVEVHKRQCYEKSDLADNGHSPVNESDRTDTDARAVKHVD